VFLLVLAVIAAVGAAVAAPLLQGRQERSRDTHSEQRIVLEARKEAKYREIRDAETDFRTGKLSEADYRALDRSLRQEAIEILRAIDDLGEQSA
jgi:Flp pilus assembly protein TadB